MRSPLARFAALMLLTLSTPSAGAQLAEELVVQVAVVDAGAPAGVALSNA